MMLKKHFQRFSEVFTNALLVVSTDRFVNMWYCDISVFINYGKIHRGRKYNRGQKNGFRIAKNSFTKSSLLRFFFSFRNLVIFNLLLYFDILSSGLSKTLFYFSNLWFWPLIS